MTFPDRRSFLRGMCTMPLLACGGSSRESPDGMIPDGAEIDWASGGTAAMTDKASYPDPFVTPPASCALVATTTLGPCTTASDLVREDISEGFRGLPVRLALRVVDTACNPLVGAVVKVWHTNVVGTYSGDTPSPAQCILTPGAEAQNFHRGVQMTSSTGTAFFDTCFPGWYRGRAIHIHFQIRMGAASTRVSQLFFPEDVTARIFATHPDYKPFGQPDTTHGSDGVLRAIAANDRSRLIVDVARMTDGAMLASKVVAVT